MDVHSVLSGRADINEMLAKIREISDKSKLQIESPSTEKSGFESVLSSVNNTLSTVNQMQSESEQIKSAYLSGDSHVSLSQLVVASQKSRLAFEGLLTVRNKLLEAYKEIMSMPI